NRKDAAIRGQERNLFPVAPPERHPLRPLLRKLPDFLRRCSTRSGRWIERTYVELGPAGFIRDVRDELVVGREPRPRQLKRAAKNFDRLAIAACFQWQREDRTTAKVRRIEGKVTTVHRPVRQDEWGVALIKQLFFPLPVRRVSIQSIGTLPQSDIANIHAVR